MLSNYQSYGNADRASLPPMDVEQGPVMSAPQMPMGMVEPEPLAPRLPADRLIKMYQAWEDAKSAELQEQYKASRYYHSKQWSDEQLKIMKRRKQPPTTKNRIKRKVDFLVGVEQRLRRDPKAAPRNPTADRAAPVATAILRFVQDVNKWPAIASDCYNDALIRGIGIQCARIAMVKGQPEIRKHRVPSDRFFYDPRSEAWDFSDARYLGECQWLDIDQAKELLPWAAELLDNLGMSSGSTGGVLPQESAKDKNWVDTAQRRVRIVQIWYKHEADWMFDFCVGNISLCPEGMDCRSPYMDDDDATTHQYEAWSPYVDERGDRYGVVRDMIPLQDEINSRSSKSLHLLHSNRTMSEAGAVADIDEMKRELARPDGHVVVAPGKKFEILEQTAQIQGNLELLQEAKAEIENLGPNPGLIGRGVEGQSGRAILAQQNSGMTELSPVFERGREWKLRCYRKDWNLAKRFWTGERAIRLTGNPEAEKFLFINRPVSDPMTGQVRMENAVAEIDVDIILDEGPDTITMREELMEQLSQLGPGAVPAEIFIEMSNITEKDTILRKMAEFKAAPPDVMEMQKRLAQLEEAQAAANVDKTRAETEAKRADAGKVMMETGVMPGQLAQAFPFYYREPTFLDMAVNMMGMGDQQQMPPMHSNALAGPPGMPPPDAMVQPNAMTGPEDMPQEDYLAQMAPYPDPREYTEPQLGERGGLPIGPI